MIEIEIRLTMCLQGPFNPYRNDRQKDRQAKNNIPPIIRSELTGTIFELNSHIKETNVLTKFHENWAKNVTSRNNTPPTGGHVFSPIWTIFDLVRDINKTNVLTNFHDDWAKIVTSRVFTTKTAPPPPAAIENCPAHWRPCFFTDLDHFELVCDINKTNVLTNFHDEWAKIVTSRVFTRKTAPPTGGHVYQLTGTTFELDQHIIKANILTNFKLDRDIIGTNLLTNVYKPNVDDGRTEDGQRLVTKAHLSNQFHDNWTTNVTSRVKKTSPWRPCF
ncbi:hypothetical protein DPMN_183954 [Dreissena polymorpha]|uniref:Uncharacterized protein n=1 Tax=Dreissena polymorpha TaxID=45954 RepID=A0A9D4I428_DREPO|nr:hypothetical protein DPMN_183954 [Dreissena polymorpha]